MPGFDETRLWGMGWRRAWASIAPRFAHDMSELSPFCENDNSYFEEDVTTLRMGIEGAKKILGGLK